MATERRDRTSFAPLDFEKENGINEDVPMVKRKRTRSLGGGGDPLSIKTLGPKERGRSILKATSFNTDGGHTVIGVIEEPLKDENENETKEERDARRSVFRRRVSFAEHANIRVIQPSDDDPASPAISSSPRTPPPPMQSPRSPSRLSPFGKSRVLSPLVMMQLASDDSESMEMAGDDVTAAFAEEEEGNMDVTDVIGGIVQQLDGENNHDEKTMDFTEFIRTEDEVTMDLTGVVQQQSPSKSKADGDDVDEEQTMDYTKAVGGLQQMPDVDDDEAITMDFTRAVPFQIPDDDDVEEQTMELTRAYIKPSSPSFNEETMEFTNILPPMLPHVPLTPARQTTPHQSPHKSSPFKSRLPTPKARVVTPLRMAARSKSPESSPFVVGPSAQKAANVVMGSPRRTPRSGIIASQLLTGRKPTASRRRSDTTLLKKADVVLGSPQAMRLLNKRKSMGATFPLSTSAPISLADFQKSWQQQEKDTVTIPASDIRSRIAQLTPKKNPAGLQTDSERSPYMSHVNDILQQIENRKRKFVEDVDEDTMQLQKKQRKTQAVSDDNIEVVTLSQFLQMTSISFLDGLTTTRRRETMAIPSQLLSTPTMADYVQAATVTLPMMELYHFSCRELKKYIHEGQEVVKQIEEETLVDNPLLFREYVSAAPDVRAIMDSQFKLLKTYARHQAKAVWYDWRQKLLTGVKDSLDKNHAGLIKDDERLRTEEDVVLSNLSEIGCRHRDLSEKLETLRRTRLATLECDQDELLSVRAQVKEKATTLTIRKEELEAASEHNTEALERRNAMLSSIVEVKKQLAEAERIQKISKSLEMKDIYALEELRDKLQTFTHCKVCSYSADNIQLLLEEELKIVLFQKDGKWAIELKVCGEQNESSMFVLDSIREGMIHVENLTDTEIIHRICQLWDCGKRLHREVTCLSYAYPTKLYKQPNRSLLIQSVVLLPRQNTKISVSFTLSKNIVYQTSADVESVQFSIDLHYGQVDKDAILQRLRLSYETLFEFKRACDGLLML